MRARQGLTRSIYSGEVNATTPPPVAIIIPCFNSGRFLLEALDSALAQTIDVEVVVCDDGSEDTETLRALDQIRARRDAPVEVVSLDRNRGVSAARNKAIACASAPYLLFLDADDRLDPRFAEEAVEVLNTNPGVLIVSSPLQCFGADDRIVRYGGAPRGVADLLFENLIPVASVIHRREWERVGGFDETITWAEDYDMWVRVLADGGVCIELEEPRYLYRQHSSQATSSMTQEDIDEMQLALVQRHPEVWADHVVDVMERYFQNQRQLRHYRRRYGRLEASKARLVDVGRGFRAKLRG